MLHAPFDVRVDEVPEPRITRGDEAIVRITHSAIGGDDLAAYRGVGPGAQRRLGRECIGIVEATGPEVRGVAVGDLVVMPPLFSDSTCQECLAGQSSGCRSATHWGTSG